MRLKFLVIVLAVLGCMFPSLAQQGISFDFKVDDVFYKKIPGTNTVSIAAPYPAITKYGGAMTIPETVTYDVEYTVVAVGNKAFNGSNVTSVTLPETVTSIGDEAFSNTRSLNAISMPGVVTIGAAAFQNCSGIKELDLPKVETIANSGFDMCTGITSLNAPVLKTVGTYNFRSATQLTELILPSIETIGNYSLYYMSKLTTLYLGENFESAGESVFTSCGALTTVTSMNPVPPVISSFSDVFSNCTLFVPEGAVNAYRAADIWKNFTNIETIKAPLPEGNLIFSDWEMEYLKNQTGQLTVQLPISLEVDAPFSYMGFQFDIQLPEFLEISSVILGNGLDGNVAFAEVSAESNIWRIVVYADENEGEGYDIVDNLVTINLTGLYSNLYPGEYPVVIDNTIFSTVDGRDIKTIQGWTGQVKVTSITVNATSVEINKVSFEGPSYITPEDAEITSATVGENLVMTVVVEPEDTTDEITWSVTLDGVENDNISIEYDDEADEWILNTENVSLEPNESVNVVVTASCGDYEDSYQFTLNALLLGDSNDNGDVSVADVVTTANYVAGLTSKRFDFPNANVIDDSEISATDVTATVQIILGTWNGVENAGRRVSNMISNDYLGIDNFKITSSSFTIPVYLNNTLEYSAIQANIKVPEGMTVKDVTPGLRAHNHMIIHNIHEDGNIGLIIFSLSNAAFENYEGALFNLEVTAEEDCGDILIEDVIAADGYSRGYILGYAGGQNETTTAAVDSIGVEDKDANYFKVDGVRINQPQAGDIIIRKKGDKVEKVIM